MRAYLLVMLVAAATTFLLCSVCRQLALRTGAVAQVRDRDVHTIAMPYLGGLAMLFGVGAAFLVALQQPFLGSQELVRHDAVGILMAAAVICGVGVLDDMFDLNALAKLAGQVLAAGVAVVNGVKMLWIPLPNSIYSLDDAAAIAITVFFIVLCVNAINFADGLDGLAAGVVGIGATAYFGYAYMLTVEQELVRATTSSLITVTIVGVCLGFLPHNFFPARMFMGDSGAMLLGLLMATSTISLTGQIDPGQLQADSGGLIPAYLPLVLPVAVLALPFADLVLAYVRRTVSGGLWFMPDKQHLHHRLLERGHSHRRAVILMYVWTAVISFGVIAIGFTQTWITVGVLLVVIAALTIITVRRAGRRRAAEEHLQP
ncbi:MraY family glycosyltransferase [Parenemella sanctibonifatiensis]|uniref:Undecaprenyl-phosphate alpha-N-acetylglucosaminyl 1-phosphate transferase n=1 Tax=Parenemella sanctibonifatiensis TaxID=2016505 RepID=A0A255EHC7_9ACTN|nr:MraY family glycosyltransferase [Parenemella sanctibonifatiensis]OYN90948.1 undecaprenyl-phosphate alpha-N-acetylglucosaminyl 1-phosphate transferase [Parenemella sanctibonifatiensis]